MVIHELPEDPRREEQVMIKRKYVCVDACLGSSPNDLPNYVKLDIKVLRPAWGLHEDLTTPLNKNTARGLRLGRILWNDQDNKKLYQKRIQDFGPKT
jgi:hypothetical protein